MKKQTGSKGKTFYATHGLIPEFVRMSRMPGIGAYYYEKNKTDIYSNDKVYIPTKKGVRESIPPPFFDRLYYKSHPKKLYGLKKKREKSIAMRDANLKRLYPHLTTEQALYNDFTVRAKQALYLKNMRGKL